MTQRLTITDRARALTGDFLMRMGRALYQRGLHPDLITAAGFVLVMVAAFLIARGEMQWGAVILLLGLPLDALDGAVARAMQRTGKFGAVLDSTLDRYADAFIFAALGYHFAVRSQFDYLLLAFASLMGSYVVSYVRARAGEASLSVKVGVFDRFVRVIIILAMLFIADLLPVGLWVLAIGTNITGLQRLWYVYRLTEQQNN